ncbi:MAG: glucosaminidase domain-containing protein, partial [Hyphomonas sp.]|nr:glucosaminidase domain-containing protein [Hyphomonas sp.]
MSAVVLCHSAFAAELPQVKVSEANTVPACATPGRLSAFLEQRNGALDPKFQNIAADYMRIGEELNIRWDMAFFQMLLETGNLRFTGDVSSDQNNFAGLGATGRKNPGESFPDVETGVKAHLQHLLMYAGETVDQPVAERTRKVQEWGVLTSWHKSLKEPVTYTALARKWAPGSRGYARDIENVSDAFYSGLCRKDDPKPEMMALARPQSKTAANTKKAIAEVAAAADETGGMPKVSGAELARRAVAEARASGSFVRSNLGASSIAETAETTAAAAPAVTEEKKPAAFKIINAEAPVEAAESPAAEAAVAAAEAEAEAEAKAAAKRPAAAAKEKVLTAALGSSATAAGGATAGKSSKAATADKSAAGKCRVWTASYGGAHAIIIKAAADDMVNYTVLDVNEGTAKREAEAYIAAYAKGGQTV